MLPSPYVSRVLKLSRVSPSGSLAILTFQTASTPIFSALPPTVKPSAAVVNVQPAGALTRVTLAGSMPAGSTTRSDLMPALSFSASPVKVSVTSGAPAVVLSADTSTCAKAGPARPSAANPTAAATVATRLVIDSSLQVTRSQSPVGTEKFRRIA